MKENGERGGHLPVWQFKGDSAKREIQQKANTNGKQHQLKAVSREVTRFDSTWTRKMAHRIHLPKIDGSSKKSCKVDPGGDV